jgi:hypothetical protein
LLAITAACAMLGAPLASEAGQGRGRARGLAGNPGVHRGSDANQGRGRANARIFQDPASATGYDSGYDRGASDGRDGQRYDPVKHKDYRDAERGYSESYGSRDGYKTNFRTGFRQGYEDGYRDGSRNKK